MEDSVREFIKQARGDKPIEADPTTGFHPDQLEAYPLARVGPRLYTSNFEAFSPGEEDVFYVNSQEMDEYNRFGLEPEQMFDDVPISYDVMNSEISFRGRATMRITDFDQYENIQEMKDREDVDYVPNTVPVANQGIDNNIEIDRLEDIRRKLSGESVSIRVRPMV